MSSISAMNRPTVPVHVISVTPPAPAPTNAAERPVSVFSVDLMEHARPPNAEQVARRFYEAFEARDYKTMEELYAPDVKFHDSIFDYPDRAGAMGMWKKILGDPEKNKFHYEFKRMEGDVAVGVWVADYKLFGRPVHNVIESRMTVRDGRIVDHKDNFDLGKWVRQALPLGPLANFKPVQSLVRGLIRHFAS